jgi:hypothetical protein
MKTSAATPLRSRIIQEEAYAAAGQPDFAFKVPQPFTPSMFEAVAAELAISAVGFASQANQVLAENLGNNMASRVKKAVKDGIPLPTQADMDALIADYDFTGVRQSSIAIGSLFDKIFARLAGASIRKLLKASGYQGTPAPVTVAKRGKDTGPSEIDYETFESEVSRLMEGEGPWGEKQAFIDLRQTLMDEAKAEEERVRANESETENKLAGLGL